MKNLKLPVLVIMCLIFALNSCVEDECMREITYIDYIPVYMTMAEIQDVKTEGAKALEKPGKIYFYNNYIFVNEVNKGIHIIDNTDPTNPTNISFINIPANRDMAIQGNNLYADNGGDLITLDISNPLDVQLKDRQTKVFKELYEYPQGYLAYNNEKEVTKIVDCNSSNFNRGNFINQSMDANIVFNSSAGSSTNTSSGVGGSMARFTITQGHLYAVNNSDMKVFDLVNPELPNAVNDISIGWGIETIFPYKDKLFIGSNAGMFIFDNSTPSSPTQLSSFQHARACDPVYVKDNYAYVTLRSGTWCEGFTNQLDLIDITDLTNPVLEKTFNMDNPHGLSIKGDNLYLCEGEFGLKTFDISDPMKLNRNKIDHIKDLHSYDAINIPNSDIIMVIGNDGLYQYNTSNPSKLEEISKIEISNN